VLRPGAGGRPGAASGRPPARVLAVAAGSSCPPAAADSVPVAAGNPGRPVVAADSVPVAVEIPDWAVVPQGAVSHVGPAAPTPGGPTPGGPDPGGPDPAVRAVGGSLRAAPVVVAPSPGVSPPAEPPEEGRIPVVPLPELPIVVVPTPGVPLPVVPARAGPGRSTSPEGSSVRGRTSSGGGESCGRQSREDHPPSRNQRHAAARPGRVQPDRRCARRVRRGSGHRHRGSRHVR
jgi:hypothetical protein